MNANSIVTNFFAFIFIRIIAGYFSLINDKGVPTATLYTTITKLVREKVYKFLSVDNLTAYTEQSQSNGKSTIIFNLNLTLSK